MKRGSKAHWPWPLLLAFVVGCAASQTGQVRDLDSRIAELEREETRRQARLGQLGKQIAAAEDKLAVAQEQARRTACKAERVAVEARLVEQEARCGLELSRYEACAAKNDASTSKKALGGCGLGILAGILSGGALAPLAVAGCAGGYVAGKATESECGEAPTCHLELPKKQQVVRARIMRLAACERGEAEPERPYRGRDRRGRRAPKRTPRR